MRRNLIQNCLIGLLACTASAAAMAQYAWIDGHGVRQYSDQPPPKSIAKARILQQPAESLRNNAPIQIPTTATVSTAGTSASDGTTAAQVGVVPVAIAAGPKMPLTTADKNADFVKRQAETMEKDKKLAEEARQAAAKIRQCEQARSYARSLQSGERIAVTGKDGERAYMSDEKRVQENIEARRALDSCS
ncbi:MAG: DUF4124 domain-containing protein [Herminiimonas sp.]|nr:DUF4124 domain-containing protein [Herminiimonas sp.]